LKYTTSTDSRVDDDQIETSVFYRRIVTSSAIRTANDAQGNSDEPFADGDSDISLEHGLAEDGQPASCELLDGENGPIDCRSCLAKRISELAIFAREQLEVLRRVLRAIHDAGKDGIALTMLQVCFVHFLYEPSN